MQQTRVGETPASISTPTPITHVFCLILSPKGLEESVIGILDSLGVPGFTDLGKVTGRGERGRRFDNPVWPGADSAIFTVTPVAQATELSNAIVEFSNRVERDSRGMYGVRVFTWPCEQVH